MSKSTYYEHYNLTQQPEPGSNYHPIRKESDFDFGSECHKKSIMGTKLLNMDEGGDNCYDFMDSDDCMAEDDRFNQQFYQSENIHSMSQIVGRVVLLIVLHSIYTCLYKIQ